MEVVVLAVLLAALAAGAFGLWRLSGYLAKPGLWRGVCFGSLCLLALSSAAFLVWKFSKARTMQLGGRIISHAVTSRPVVALTFDDGPTPEGTEAILPILHEYGVPATFFVVGRELEGNPEQARMIAAEGHELGNHTYSHATMIGRPLSYVAQEIETTDRLIRAAGYQGEIRFRPPYCKKLVLLPYYLWRTGRTSVTFDVEPESYPEVAKHADTIVAHVLERARPGSVILLHVMYGSGSEARQAVPGIIEGLQEKGYHFVTVSELLADSWREPADIVQ
jgi:peptidoglycan/xylan/chitin deacetylase (PgdA/CDA1 family)